MSGYATETWVTNKGYITSAALNGYAKTSDIPSLSGYATETWVTNKGYITSAALNGYATQAWVEAKKYLTAIPSEYVTETELSSTLGGYQTKITSSNKLAYSLISGTPTSLPASDVYDWAKAATKPSYTASEVGALSTSGGTITNDLTVNGYLSSGKNYIRLSSYYLIAGTNWRVTDASWQNEYTLYHTGNFNPADYLPKSGGTISGNLLLNQYLKINAWSGYGSGSANVWYDGNVSRLYWENATDMQLANNVVLHGGNYSSYALPLSGGVIKGAGANLFGIDRTDGNPVAEFRFNGSMMGRLGFDTSGNAIGVVGGSQVSLIHSGNIGSYNAGSATKLQTARTIWGQSFDGSGNVSGALYDTSGQEFIYSSGNLVRLGTGTAAKGCNTYIDGNNIYLRYGTAYKDGIALTSSGNVLIGTTSDNGARLQVNGAMTITSAVRMTFYGTSCGLYPNNWITNDGVTNRLWLYNDNQLALYGSEIQLRNNTNVSGNLTATGEVISTRRATSSDARLKDNINRLIAEDCLSMVRNLQPSSWDWKENGEYSVGFIAQDIEPLMPYAVTKIKDDVLGQRLNLQYDQFFAPVVGAIQCLDSEIEQLKKRVKYLENKLQEYGYNRY